MPPPLPRRNRSVLASLASRPLAAFPASVTGRLPHHSFRGLLSVHFALRPAWSLSRPRRPFVIGVLRPMSLPPSSAPTATGWSDSCRAGFAPAEEWRLVTAHTESPVIRPKRTPPGPGPPASDPLPPVLSTTDAPGASTRVGPDSAAIGRGSGNSGEPSTACSRPERRPCGFPPATLDAQPLPPRRVGPRGRLVSPGVTERRRQPPWLRPRPIASKNASRAGSVRGRGGAGSPSRQRVTPSPCGRRSVAKHSYSARKAIIGSSRAARRAGIAVATTAARTTAAAAAVNVAGS